MVEMLKRLGDVNIVEKLTDALVDNMKFSSYSLDYPNVSEAKPDDGVPAEWFYPVYNGSNGFSELSAIHQYVSQETQFEQIGTLMLGIALVEMKHYAKLGDLIKSLGGAVHARFSNVAVKVGKTPLEAIDNAIEAENATVTEYSKLLDKIKKLPETKTTEVCVQLLNKLQLDEEVHLTLLKSQKTELEKQVKK